MVNLLDGEAGSVDLWHVVAHADTGKANANESVVWLSDASHLRTDHFKRTKARNGFLKRRPLVFLNACSASMQGWSITMLGGWAKTCVADCRCGAFIGPLWNVGDKLAAEFSRAFYEELSKDNTLGEAARRARERVRGKSGIDPIWLAYSVYGDPNGRVYFGGSPYASDGDA